MTCVTDALTGQPRIVAPGRAKRLGPRPEGCPFCRGNEESTPPEISRVDGADGLWSARAVPNLFPLMPAHEVLIAAPRHVTSLRELRSSEWLALIELWAQRSAHHASAGSYAHLFVNDGAGAGASLPHSHAQLVVVPDGAYTQQLYGLCIDAATCTACALAHEIDRDLVVDVTESFVLAASATPRTNAGLVLLPRAHVATLGDVDQVGFADAMATAVAALPEGDFNCWVVQHAPSDAHWYVEFAPRTSTPAGVELALGIGVSIVDPAVAAEHARERVAELRSAR